MKEKCPIIIALLKGHIEIQGQRVPVKVTLGHGQILRDNAKCGLQEMIKHGDEQHIVHTCQLCGVSIIIGSPSGKEVDISH